MMRALMATLVCGCAAGVPPMASAPSDETTDVVLTTTHAIADETMELEVKLRGIPVGRVQVAAGRPGVMPGGDEVIIVQARGTSMGLAALIGDVRWEMTTHVDLRSGFALGETEQFVSVVAGKRKQDRTVRSWRPDQQHHNVHSAIGALRGWRSHLGEQTTIHVFLGTHSMNVELRDSARAIIGTTPAVRYTGIADEKFSVTIWISDDADRVPLRAAIGTMLGDVKVDLVRYD